MFIYSMKKLTELKAIQLAELFSALSDASRIRLIALLMDGEMSVRALAEGVGMTESAVSHQLRGLRHMHLVRTRKSGRQVFYSIDDDHVSRLFTLGLDHVQHG
ncbi:MAG TPA: metalloregulator ArsR/SmtB family transcription factor [Anaerolineales bacterium]|nr:metalloregulator ArsR/SmtB family transcription factor [Anaerolineales bacterium]